jgi:hypothetical protein
VTKLLASIAACKLAAPQLALEDLTRDDIRIYVRDAPEENSRFKALRARDDRGQELVLEIVDKALPSSNGT